MSYKGLTRCKKIINRHEDLVEICGKLAKGNRILESLGVYFRVDLCQEHLKEFEKKEYKEKERKEKLYEKTDFKCPECGSPVFKHYHVKRDLYPEYRWFWCPHWCDLDCRNCIHSDGENCSAFFCLNMSSWSPKIKEE